MRRLVWCVIAMTLGGCASGALEPGQAVLPAAPFVTKETGRLTIERQEFINTWAAVQVLYDVWLAGEKQTCLGPCAIPARCARIPDVEAQGKVIYLTTEAKLRNPEAEMDWGNVAKILGLIAKMVL